VTTSSRRSFLGTTICAAALTIFKPLADAVVDQNATPTPAAPALLRVHAAPCRPAALIAHSLGGLKEKFVLPLQFAKGALRDS
jgi:hypothetical protein